MEAHIVDEQRIDAMNQAKKFVIYQEVNKQINMLKKNNLMQCGKVFMMSVNLSNFR